MHWARLAERGCAFGLWLVEASFRVLGARTARLMLYPVVAYFLVANSTARRASRQYFARLNACAPTANTLPRPGWGTSFRHMLAFGESGLDKLAAWLGDVDPARVDFPARAQFDAMVAGGRGALLIGAHLGNLEMLRALAVGQRLAPIHAIAHTRHAQRFRRVLARAHRDFGVNLIEVSELGADTAMLLSEKIERGELVAMVGDRIPPGDSSRICTVDFLGRQARFPQGPFILAAALGCPVYLFLCLKQSGRYGIHLEHFAERIELPRSQREARLAAHVQRYAARLQHYCLSHPYQWFNFFDYWSVEATGDAGKAAPAPRQAQPSVSECKP
jgi:predicted LPLAT superfamily acyltransferase